MPKLPEKSKTALSEWVSVDRHFQKAMRLDLDVSNQNSLDGYVAQGTSRRALETMAAHLNSSRQRSFTWTGPYGCGKSSLALLLCSLLGPSSARAKAREILALGDGDTLAKVFQASKGWAIDTLVGRQGNLTADLANHLKVKCDSKHVLAALNKRAQSQKAPDGYLLIIDELGKYLEAECASENAYMLQEIAEAANRSDSTFVFLGILHQAVDVYASRLPRSVRDEWMKVQGRFADIPLLSSSEETVELLGYAITHPNGTPSALPAFTHAVKLVAGAFAKRRPETAERIEGSLIRCWPLNPVTTLLLGPISRRKFAQNERSIYSFLSAAEPYGFRAFVESEGLNRTFDPADYWDYLRENFETAIITTGEGHRWMTAVEAITRAERTGTSTLVRLAKAVALIDLFRTGSGIEATVPILAASVGLSEQETESALRELITMKVVIERRYAESFAIFAGSDFDIEESLKDARSRVTGLDACVISHLAKLPPVVAREHYLRMGTMRWLERRILPAEQLASFAGSKLSLDGASGVMVLLLPETKEEELSPSHLQKLYAANALSASDARNLILGASASGHRIRELLEEVQALNIVGKDPSLEGDETARAEVRARMSHVQSTLADELTHAFANSVWIDGTERTHRIERSHDLITYASSICDRIFPDAPAISNELINRDHLSSQMVSARRELLTAMVGKEALPKLDFEGFPPAYALYLSILRDLHIEKDGQWRFELNLPEEGKEDDESNQAAYNYGALWKKTIALLKQRPMTTGKELFNFWAKPPYGLKAGVIPILALAFYLTNRKNLAVYLAGAFQPAITTVTVDEWLVDPTRIAFRWIEPTEDHLLFVTALANKLTELVTHPVDATPLSVAKAIVEVVLTAPRWAQRSTSYTAETLKLKNTVVKASDPIQLLYRDLPSIYNSDIQANLAEKVFNSLKEFTAATPGMINHVREHLFSSLNATPADLENLRSRAQNVKGLSGDLTLDAFIARLETFEDKQSDIEGIISLATGRPSTLWTDREILVALSRISELAFEFRKQESFAELRGRDSNRRIFSVVFGVGEGDMKETFELTREEDTLAKQEGSRFAQHLKSLPRHLALAILTEAGQIVSTQKKE